MMMKIGEVQPNEYGDLPSEEIPDSVPWEGCSIKEIEPYATFAGCDISAVFADKTIGDIRPISVKITRDTRAGMFTLHSTVVELNEECTNQKNKRFLLRAGSKKD